MPTWRAAFQNGRNRETMMRGIIAYIRKCIRVLSVACVLSLAVLGLAAAQQQPGHVPTTAAAPSAQSSQVNVPADANQPPNSSTQQSSSTTRTPVYLTTKTPYEFYLAGLTIFLGVAAMVLVVCLFWNHVQTKTDEFVKLFAFVIVAFSAIFLIDRKSTRLNSSHTVISYAVFCLKKKNKKYQ